MELTFEQVKILVLMNPLNLYLCVFLCVFSYSLSAQYQRCAAHEHHIQKIQNNPDFKQNRIINEERVNKYIRDHAGQRSAIMTIPVVFQVFHNGDAVGSNENLSVAQLQAGLDQLNDDYGRTNSDAGNTPAPFQSVAADTEIQFCLATEDPNGNPTSGVKRYNINSISNINQNQCWDPSYVDSRFVNPYIWDRDKYLNIFSLLRLDDRDESNQCVDDALLGFAQFPGGPANADAAVHAYFTIGSIANPNPDGGQYGLGRTVTHEVGHWLNLDHVWGYGGCAAGDDDMVADTPNQSEENYDCPSFPLTDNCTTGGDGVMFMNYMDYVNDDCMNMFTQGQGDRMIAAINTYRPGLMSSLCNSSSTCPPIVTTTNGNISSGSTEAGSTIISASTVLSTANVEFSAPTSICLENGFEVIDGGLFATNNVGCN